MKRPTLFLVVTRKDLKLIIIILLIIISIALLPSINIIKVMKINRIGPLYGKIIVIDPGHGGIDGGTYFKDILEKNINLTIGLKLKEQLIKKGAAVVMTREIDDSLDDHSNSGNRHRQDLNARVKVVNDNKADIFISIHVNHAKNTNRMGAIVYYYKDSEKSKVLAEHLQSYLNNLPAYKKIETEIKHSPIPGDYYILRNTSSIGVIVETGFISNEVDRNLLLNDEHLSEIVQLITKSIIDYFRSSLWYFSALCQSRNIKKLLTIS